MIVHYAILQDRDWCRQVKNRRENESIKYLSLEGHTIVKHMDCNVKSKEAEQLPHKNDYKRLKQLRVKKETEKRRKNGNN